ncbi:MAG: formylglycine-generating enzyme family protein [Paludibacteraceae bacterium]|nr:formylglycine-generating enzyme family protein [Paludibacteraceae bacterium]
MKHILTFCLLAVTMCAVAQTKKVAVYIAKNDAWNQITKNNAVVFANALQIQVNQLPQYTAVERSNKYLALLSQDHSYQRNGQVDETQVAALGKQDGVDIVLGVSILEYPDNTWYVVWKMVDVVTAELLTGNYLMKRVADILEVDGIAKELSAQIKGETSSSSYSSSPHFGTHADFTEDAWGINMKMIWVEGGDFLMGCTSEQSDCDDDEKNVRRVTVDGYWIGMCEVTQSQWEKVIGTSIYQQKSKANGSNTYGVGADYPIYYVSWDEAMEFCRLLSNKTRKTYTLPTEAQWEYAARGGNKADGSKYAGSNMINVVGWYTDNSGSSTHPVATKRPNGLGLYDMSGNVYEWCKDWYSSGYAGHDTNNPTGASSGSDRVFRGGSWGEFARNCRVSYRNAYPPSLRFNYLGFRVVLLP